jgi:hypothetical protein
MSKGQIVGQAITYSVICGLYDGLRMASSGNSPTLWLQASYLEADFGDVVYVVFVIDAQGSLCVYQVLDDGRRVPVERFLNVTWHYLPPALKEALLALEKDGRWTRQDPDAKVTRKGARTSDPGFTEDEMKRLVRVANDNANTSVYRSGRRCRE